MEETKLNEESGFDAGVVRNTDTRATTGSVMRQADVTRSLRTSICRRWISALI